MITIKSMRTQENKLMAVLVKDESFFIFFSKFMLNCGIEWEHNENREGTTNIMESYISHSYFVDLCFGSDVVFVIIRTRNDGDLGAIKKWISNNSTWQIPKLKA